MISIVCVLLCDVYMLLWFVGLVVLLSLLMSVVILLVGLCGSIVFVMRLVDEFSRLRLLLSVWCRLLVLKCCGVMVGFSR